MALVDNKIILAIGSSGGSGVSTFSINLAAILSKKAKVLVVEMGADNISFLSSMVCRKSTIPILHEIFKISCSNKMVESYLQSDIPKIGFVRADFPSRDNFLELKNMLFRALGMYGFIVIDGGSNWLESRDLFEISDGIALLSRFDPASIEKSRSIYFEIRKDLFERSQLEVVLNMTSCNVSYNYEYVRSKVEKEFNIIPYAGTEIFESLLKSSPLCLTNSTSDYYRHLNNISHRLIQGQRSDSLDNEASVVQADNTDVDVLKIRKEAVRRLLMSDEINKIIRKDVLLSHDVDSLKDRISIFVKDILKEILPQNYPKAPLIIREIVDEVVSLGPLESLLSDPDITEIMVNKYNSIFVERNGKIEKTPLSFISEKSYWSIAEKIVAPIGRRIDEMNPVVDARLKDGSRVHIIIPPLSVDSPVVTVRKFSKSCLTIDDLISGKSISLEMAEFLKECILKQKNIIISGGTSSGKSTFLNILSSFVPKNERIITIEDSIELKLNQPHVIRLEARPPNIEGKGEITIRDLVRASLRMRPDRIIVGECRGGEALDMMQAMNTGHDGSLTTLHANSSRDALRRLETLVLFAGFDIPLKAIRENIVSSIDLVVHLQRSRDGVRRVVDVSEVTGIENELPLMHQLYSFSDNEFRSSGYSARCLE